MEVNKQYIDSQEHWEDSINSSYEHQKERDRNQQKEIEKQIYKQPQSMGLYETDIKPLFTINKNEELKRFEFTPKHPNLNSFTVSFGEVDGNEDRAWRAVNLSIMKNKKRDRELDEKWNAGYSKAKRDFKYMIENNYHNEITKGELFNLIKDLPRL